jgi:hypothetical protein
MVIPFTYPDLCSGAVAMRQLACGLLLTTLAVAPVLADTLRPLGGRWNRYANQRFGTVLDIPSEFQVVEPPPENGDGREFRADDGSRLLVYGSYGPDALMSNFDDYKVGRVAQARLDGVDVTYEKGGTGWLVFSGLKGENIVYSKVVDGCGAAHEFTIEYPAARKKFFDRVVARISGRLSCRKP